MSLKDLIKSRAVNKPPRILLMGESGVGKTAFASCFNTPLFIQPAGEEGIETLMANGVVESADFLPACPDWTTLREYTSQAAELSHKTVVFDGIGSIEELLHQHVCNEKYDGDMSSSGFLSFMVGYKTSIPFLREWLCDLDKLREAGKTVLLLGHSSRRTFKNPTGTDYGKIMLDVHDRTSECIKRWADMMLYYAFDVSVSSTDGKVGKAKSTDRVLFTQPEAGYDAKNRYIGLEPEIDAGLSHQECYANFCAAIKAAKGTK